MTLLKVSRINTKPEGGFALRDINFTQGRWQKVAIAGEPGSGKSSLLKIIAGLKQQESGEVWLDSEMVKGPSQKLVPGHPAIAYLSQYFELQKFLTVEQILGYANVLPEGQASALYELCEINPFVNRKTDQLSGGERQRIALARLLITSPKLLLLDEPFSHLDMVHKKILKAVIKNISRKLKITCLLVSHDPSDTLAWADKILVMKDGQVIQDGTPESVYRDPVNEYVAGLFGKYIVATPGLVNSFSSKDKRSEKKLFFRPEDFKLVTKGETSMEGLVSEVIFLGHCHEVEVLIAGETITVKTTRTDIKIGDKVYLSRV